MYSVFIRFYWLVYLTFGLSRTLASVFQGKWNLSKEKKENEADSKQNQAKNEGHKVVRGLQSGVLNVKLFQLF